MTAESCLDIARWYEPLFGRVLAGLREMAVRVSHPKPGMKVLDVGCGTGAQLVRYQARGCDVYGVDLSVPMLRVASEELGVNAQLQNCDAVELPYKDEAFDIVHSALFLHQLSSELCNAALAEAVRVMRTDGHLLLIDFHPAGSSTIKSRFSKFLISGLEFLAGWEHFSNSRQFLARGGIPHLAGKHDLQVRKAFIVGNGNIGVYLLHIGKEVWRSNSTGHGN